MNDSFFGRLGDLVTKPSRLMDNVGAAPRWPLAGVLIFVIMGAFTWLISPISGPEQMELMRDSKLMQMMPEEQWQQQYEDSMNPAPFQRALGAVGGAFGAWISIILLGLILGFFVRMSGGQGTMKQAIGIVSWGSVIPFAIGTLVKAPLVLATESVFKVTIGLAALVPGDPGSPLFMILSNYGDFFAWWGLFVLIVGFERVFQVSRQQAATAVLLPWGLLTGIMVGVGLLFM